VLLAIGDGANDVAMLQVCWLGAQAAALTPGRGYYTAGKWRLPTEERCKMNGKKVPYCLQVGSREEQGAAMRLQAAGVGVGLLLGTEGRQACHQLHTQALPTAALLRHRSCHKRKY